MFKMKTVFFYCSVLTLIWPQAYGATPNVASKANNVLGLKLAKEFSVEKKGKNFIVSPISLFEALGLAVNGTGGVTKDQVEKLLGADLEQINKNNLSNLESLRFSFAQKEELKKRKPWMKPAVLNIENSAWHTNGNTDGLYFRYSEEFTKKANKYFGAPVTAVDFKKDGVYKVNDWAKEKTNGLIPKILNSTELSPMVWLILNATYLEANWRTPFVRLSAEYRAPKFHLLDGTEKSVDMLVKNEYMHVLNDENGDQLGAIELATDGSEHEIDFVAFLPHEGKEFNQFQEEILDPKVLNERMRKLYSRVNVRKTAVTMPAFSFDSTVKLEKDKELTRAMNLNFLFSPYADFSHMSSPESEPSTVGLIKQKARIEVDENGLKAAAVTAVGGVRATSVPRPPEVSLTLDRPFVFTIVERKTQNILFVGSVVNP